MIALNSLKSAFDTLSPEEKQRLSKQVQETDTGIASGLPDAPLTMAQRAPAWQSDPVVDASQWAGAPVAKGGPAWANDPVVSEPSGEAWKADPIVDAPEITAAPSFTGELSKGNLGAAAGIGLENVRREFSGLIGPTEKQRFEESVPFGTDEQGQPKYEYKPLGNRLEQEQGLMTPFVKPETYQANEGDPAWKATGKALVNTGLGIEGSLLSPGGLMMGGGASVPALSRAAAGAFGADMAGNLPDSIKRIGSAPTTQGKIEAALQTLSGVVLGGLGATHAIKGTKAPVPAADLADLQNAMKARQGAALAGKDNRIEITTPQGRTVRTSEGTTTTEPSIALGAGIPGVPSSQALGFKMHVPILSDIGDWLATHDIGQEAKVHLGYWANRSLPRIASLGEELGNKGVRWAAARDAAVPLADAFTKEVIGDSGVQAKKLGAALTEDNLRSIKKDYLDSGDAKSAANVKSIIGAKGSPFATEAEYQAFLKDAKTQTVLDRYKTLWDQHVEPLYKQAMVIDPSTPLSSRGLQTGARVNLFSNPEKYGRKSPVIATGGGNLRGTMQKKSPFGTKATGASETYETDLGEMTRNTYGKQMETAKKNDFDKMLVDSGNAVIAEPGETPMLPDGTPTSSGMPFKSKLAIGKDGKPVLNKLGKPVRIEQRIYLRPSIFSEYRGLANVEEPANAILGGVGALVNQSALAGMTDVTVHLSNLATSPITRPGGSGAGLGLDTALSLAGRADLIPTALRYVEKSFSDNTKQLAELTEIGAARRPHDTGSMRNPLNWSPAWINWFDKTTRLVLDDTFNKLAKDGVLVDSESNRREFVNQVGAYNMKVQSRTMRWMRQSNLSPFLTAGKTFNASAFRMATLSPGAEATSTANALMLRANAASKWVGALAGVGIANYLINGKMLGRPGTGIGEIDTGKNDANGRPLRFNVFKGLGLDRALRVTGLKGVINAKIRGLPNNIALDQGIRDALTAQIAPYEGPLPRFGAIAAFGQSFPGIIPEAQAASSMGSQFKNQMEAALWNANPVVASIHDANKPGGSIEESLNRQLPRFLPSSGQMPELMEHYPEIVSKSIDSRYTDDVIGRARRMKPEARKEYLQSAIKQIPEENRPAFMEKLKERRIFWTKDEQEQKNRMDAMEEALKRGDRDRGSALKQDAREHGASTAQINAEVRKSVTDPRLTTFKRLSPLDKQRVYDAASPQYKDLYGPFLKSRGR